MTQQHTPEPVALMHADWLSKSLTIGAANAAAELRRLHLVEKHRDDLMAALELAREEMSCANFNSASERIDHAIASAKCPK